MINHDENVKEIKITYKDGTEKIIHRGVCLSVYEKNDSVYVNCDGVSGSQEDVYAVLAVMASVAKELGIDDELCSKAREVEKGA